MSIKRMMEEQDSMFEMMYGAIHDSTDINRTWANAYYSALDDGENEYDAREVADDVLAEYLKENGVSL